MREFDRPDKEKPNQELTQSFKKENTNSPTANPDESQSVQQSELNNPSGAKKDSAAIAHRAAGPRTAAGKKRSRRNALKNGIFSSAAIVEGESIAEDAAILDGLRKDRQPVGMLECILVEKIATIVWRQRRHLLAASAEVHNARLFSSIDSALVVEAWDRSRAGETSGGMLRHTSNPIVIEEAIGILTLFRDGLEISGFQKGVDLWPLRKLYGLDHDGEAPFGIFHIYEVFSMLAENTLERSEKGHSHDELKKTMIEILNVEIEGLKTKQNLSKLLMERKEHYQSLAASVPPSDVMERHIRYEAHLSREFDRTLNQVDRLQRIRRGQPVPPSIRLEL